MITVAENFKSSIVKVDIGKEYERISILGKIFNFLWITLVTLLPYKISNSLLIQSKKAEAVKVYSTQYRALEVMYTHRKQPFRLNWAYYFDKIWLNQRNPKALRNRLKLFKKILKAEIENYDYQNNIKILSLGSGSARGVIEALSENKSNKLNLRATLIDKDDNAINYSKYLSKKFNIENLLNYYQLNIKNSYSIIEEEDPDIIEMVGILDYFEDEKVIGIINKLFDILKNGATLITCNINENLEKKFIAKTVRWKMIYRTPSQFHGLLKRTKFCENFEIIYEPLLIHGIAILKKLKC